MNSHSPAPKAISKVNLHWLIEGSEVVNYRRSSGTQTVVSKPPEHVGEIRMLSEVGTFWGALKGVLGARLAP